MLGTGWIEPRRADAGAVPRIRCAGDRRRWRGPRLHFMDNLDPSSFGALLEALPLASTPLRRHSKSGGTGETLMQTAAALAALRDAGLASRIGELVMGLSEPRRRQQAQRAARPARRPWRAILDHDPGVGGRFSVLTMSGCCRRRSSASISPRSARALLRARAGVGASRRPRCRPRSAPRWRSRWREEQADRGDDGLCRSARRIHPVVRAALGGKPRQGRQGTTPLGALGPVDQHSQLQLFNAGPRDKLVHGHHGRHSRARTAHRGRPRATLRRAGLRRQDDRRSRRRAGPRRPRRRLPRTAVPCAPSISTASMRRASANC